MERSTIIKKVQPQLIKLKHIWVRKWSNSWWRLLESTENKTSYQILWFLEVPG
jgi:hypothetical protein